MNKNEELENFTDFLFMLVSGEVKDYGLFKDKYKMKCVRDWKPWPGSPDICFEKSFIAFMADDKSPEVTYGCGRGSHVGSPLGIPWNVAGIYGSNHERLPEDGNSSANNLLSVSDARYLCELHSLLSNAFLREIPLFAFCNGQDKQKTVLLVIGNNIRIIGIDKGMMTMKNKHFKLEEMRKEHVVGFMPPYPQMDQCTYVFYDILKSDVCTFAESMLKPTSKGFLGIECRSSTFSQMLRQPPVDSTCAVLVQAVLGDEQEGAFQKFNELQLLKVLYDSLHTGNIAWPETADQHTPVIEKLHSLFDDLKNRKQIYHSDMNISTDTSDFDSLFTSYVMAERGDMDFTDHLWFILKDCRSYQELSNSWVHVFKELENFPFVPYVCKNNSTTMAKFVNSMDKGRIKCPRLNSTKPVELLLEMGIEKLRKDYIMLFVGLEMVPYNFLLPFLEAFVHVGDSIKCLEKFHTVLEMLIKVWLHLHLPKENLSEFVRAALKHYANDVAVDPCYILSFPVSLCSIEKFVEKANPTKWQISLKSERDGFKKENIVLLNLTESDPRAATQSALFILGNPLYHITSITVIYDEVPFPFNIGLDV